MASMWEMTTFWPVQHYLMCYKIIIWFTCSKILIQINNEFILRFQVNNGSDGDIGIYFKVLLESINYNGKINTLEI